MKSYTQNIEKLYESQQSDIVKKFYKDLQDIMKRPGFAVPNFANNTHSISPFSIEAAVKMTYEVLQSYAELPDIEIIIKPNPGE